MTTPQQPTPQKPVSEKPRKPRRVWPYLVLALSLVIRHTVALLAPIEYGYADLHVYVRGAEELLTGDLYSFGLTGFGPDPLGFTYPPFAAVLFTPLSWLPFGIAAVLMTAANVVLVYVVIRLAVALVPVSVPHRRIVLWTAAALWAEPVRLTSDYGQINLVLVTLVLVAAYSTRNAVSGALVGIAAGIKLTPAVSGLYFLAVRRYTAAAWSAAAFALTIALTLVIAPNETRNYFGTLIGDTTRIGPTSNIVNQSLRGVLSRFAGHDVASGPIWIAALLAAGLLCAAAFAAVRHLDRLIVLIVVQLFALLASPISWTHHWIWTVPLVVWLAVGPLRAWRPARVLTVLWLVYLLLGANVFEIAAKAMGTSDGDVVFGLMTCPEAALTVATLVALVVSRRHTASRPSPHADAPTTCLEGSESGEHAPRSPSDTRR